MPARTWLAALAAGALITGSLGAVVAEDQVAREPFIYESLRLSYRFENDGTGRLDRVATLAVHNEAGVQQLGQLLFPHVHGRQEVSVRSLRVLSPDGSTRHEGAARVQDLPAPVTAMFPLYSDLHIFHVTVPSFHPGDRIELHVREEIETPEAPGHFWVQHRFERDTLAREEVLEIDVPASRTIQLAHPEDLPPEIEESDGRRIHRWTRSHLERAEINEKDGLLPDVELSSFADWSAVGEWYRQLRGDRALPSQAVSDKAREITTSVEGERARAEALYGYTSGELRYLGLLFGLARYQPHTADEVLASGYGDCKDKHTLLAALLRASGFETAPVLVGQQRELRPEVPSPHQFDHMITAVRVDGEWLFVDATSRVAPFAYLPPQLRGKTGLRIPDAGPTELVELPEERLVAERTDFRLEGEVDADGTFSGLAVETLRGDGEWLTRLLLLNLPSARWSEVLQRAVTAAGLDGKVSDIDVSDLTDVSSPLRLSYRLEVEDWLDPSKPSQGVDALLPRVRLPEADHETTEEETEIGGPSEASASFRVELPEGFTATPPVEVDLSKPGLGSYSSRYEVAEGVLSAERSLGLESRLLPQDALPEYEAFRGAIAKDRRQDYDVRRSLDDSLLESSTDAAELLEAGKQRLGEQRTEEAVAFFERAAELEPDHGDAWYQLGRARERGRDLEPAAQAYRMQADVDPFHEKAHAALGRVLESLDDPEGAEDAYRRHLEKDPLDEDATARLGRLLAGRGRCEDALEPLRRAVALDEDDCPSKLALARCLLLVDREPEAERALQEFVQCSDLRRLVRAFSEEWLVARTDVALGTLAAALDRWPNAASLFALRARFEGVEGRYEGGPRLRAPRPRPRAQRLRHPRPARQPTRPNRQRLGGG